MENFRDYRITVENRDFSTFSTGFSTGLFHRRNSVWISILVYIIYFDKMRLFMNFFFRQNSAKEADRMIKNST